MAVDAASARSAKAGRYASIAADAVTARIAEGREYASTAANTARARSAEAREYASMIVDAHSARCAEGCRYASTAANATRARSAKARGYASTATITTCARSAMARGYASTAANQSSARNVGTCKTSVATLLVARCADAPRRRAHLRSCRTICRFITWALQVALDQSDMKTLKRQERCSEHRLRTIPCVARRADAPRRRAHLRSCRTICRFITWALQVALDLFKVKTFKRFSRPSVHRLRAITCAHRQTRATLLFQRTLPGLEAALASTATAIRYDDDMFLSDVDGMPRFELDDFPT